MSIQQLRERRTAKAQEARKILDDHPGEKWNAAAGEKIDALHAEIQSLDDQIEIVNKQLALEAELAAANPDNLRNKHTTDPSKHGEESNALRNYLLVGWQGVEPAIAARAQERSKASGGIFAGLPTHMLPLEIRNAMSTTTNSEGGYTTAPEYQKTVEVAMKQYAAMLNIVSVFDTATGNTLNIIPSDPTSELGEIVGQNVGATQGDTTFGAPKNIDVYRYSSKKIALPWELIADSFIDIEAYVTDLLSMRIGRLFGQHITTGTGTGQPTGIVPAAGAGKVGATGQTVTVTYDDLLDLEHSVDIVYRSAPGVGFAMHDNSVKVLRKLKDTTGRPIWTPSYDTGIGEGRPDLLLGRPIYVVNDIPVMAASAKSILFGNFKKYRVRRVVDLTLFRMTDSNFTLNGQVGFVAFNRRGGNLIDVGGAVKYYQNSAT